MTSPAPRPYARRRSMWGELRGTLLLLVLVLVGLGAVQIWRGWLAPYSFTVQVNVEPNRTGLDDSAEWLFRRLEYVLASPEGGPPLAVIAHGPDAERTQHLKVRGRHLHEMIATGRLEGFLRYPGYAGDELSVRVRSVPAGPDTLRHELTQEQARSFLESPVRTYVSVRDQYGRPVSDLRSVLGLSLAERTHERGVYDLSIRVDELIWLLEEQGTYTLQVRSGAGPAQPQLLEVPAQWFIREGRESRVLSLALGGTSAAPTDRAPAATAAVTPATTPAAPPEPARGAPPAPKPSTSPSPPVANAPTAASSPAPTAAVAEGTIEIRALPYATYYVDGEVRATNVALTRVTVAAGMHAVRVEHPLFQPHEWSSVRVGAGTAQNLFHAFPSEAAGSVRVGISHGWGQVFLDGKDTGRTAPCVLEAVRVGAHTVALWRDGQPLSDGERKLVVVEGRAAEVQFELP